MFWPTVLAHKIDSDSPLWDLSARELASNTNYKLPLNKKGEKASKVNLMNSKSEFHN